jgi:HPt (histidine-containing phosphotransfer) domain-containing protein
MPEPIDVHVLRRLLAVIGGDPDDLAELIADYVAGTPKLAEEMSAAVAAGDRDSLRRAAHTLKGVARDFGALALAGHCERLEHACHADSLQDNGVEAMLADITAAEASARHALTDLDVGCIEP